MARKTLKEQEELLHAEALEEAKETDAALDQASLLLLVSQATLDDLNAAF